MRLIDADELLKWISGQSKSPSCPKNESAFGLRIMKHIDRMLSAQSTHTDTSNTLKSLDCVDRQAAIDAMAELQGRASTKAELKGISKAWKRIKKLPSVQPYTDEQIQKAQEMEQAQLDKAFELGREDAKAEIIRCKECRWRKDQSGSTAWLPCRALATPDDFYCERAERRTDE